MEIPAIFQIASTFFAAISAFGAYRARDNARAAALKEMQTDIKHILKRIDALEGKQYVRKMKKEESA